MISIEASKAIGIFQAATECMRQYQLVSMAIARKDAKEFSRMFRENAELMSKLEDFVITMRERLGQFDLPTKEVEKHYSTKHNFDALSFPNDQEEKKGVKLEDPQDDDDQDDGKDEGLAYNMKGNVLDITQFPVSFLDFVEVKGHSSGCDELSYNPTTDSITSTFSQDQGASKGVLVRKLNENQAKESDRLLTVKEYEPKFAFAPSANSLIFSSRTTVYLVKDKTKIQGILKFNDKLLLSYDLTSQYTREKFVERPFLAGPNFYCKPAVSGGQMELQVSNFDSANKVLVKIPEIKLDSEKVRNEVVTFGIFAHGQSSLVVVLSKTGFLGVKKGEANDSLLRLSLSKDNNVFLDAFYLEPLSAIFVLRKQKGKFFVDRVNIEANDSALKQTAVTISIEAEGLPTDEENKIDVTRVKLGVISITGNKLCIVIIFNEVGSEAGQETAKLPGKLLTGFAEENKSSTLSSPTLVTLVDPNIAYVSEMKLNADKNSLVATICSSGKSSDKSFSSIAVIKPNYAARANND